MGAESFNIRVVMHHVQHLAIYSLVIWQIALAIWFLLKWASTNIKFSFNSTPVILSDLVSQGKSSTKQSPDKSEIDIGSFVDIKATIPDAKIGTTALKSEKQKVKDTGTDVAKKLKHLRNKF